MYNVESGKPQKHFGNCPKISKDKSSAFVPTRASRLPLKYSTWKDEYIPEVDVNGRLKDQNGKKRKRAAGLDLLEALLPSGLSTSNKEVERSPPAKPGNSTKGRRFVRARSLPVLPVLARPAQFVGNEVSMQSADTKRSPRYHSKDSIASTEGSANLSPLLTENPNSADSYEDEGKVVHAKRINPNTAQRNITHSSENYVLTSTLKAGTTNAHGNACENKDVKDCQNACKKPALAWGHRWLSPTASLTPHYSPPQIGSKPVHSPWISTGIEEMKFSGGPRPRNTLNRGSNNPTVTKPRLETPKVFNLANSEYNPNKRQKIGNGSISSSNLDEDVVETGYHDTKPQVLRGSPTTRSAQSLSLNGTRTKQERSVKEYGVVERTMKPSKPARLSKSRRDSSQNSYSNPTNQGPSHRGLSITNPKRTLNRNSVVRIGSQPYDDPYDPIIDDQGPNGGTLFSQSQKPGMSDNVRVVLPSPPKAEKDAYKGTANLHQARPAADRLLTSESNARLDLPNGLSKPSREPRTISTSHRKPNDSYEGEDEDKEKADSLLAKYRKTQHSSVVERRDSSTSSVYDDNSEDELQQNANIQPTKFTPKQNSKSKQILRKEASGSYTFSVVEAFSQSQDFVHQGRDRSDATVTYDTDSKSLKLNFGDNEVDFGVIREKLEYSPSGTKIVIHKPRSMEKKQDGTHQIYLEFGTPKEKKEFLGVLKGVKPLEKENDYLNKVFQNTRSKHQPPRKQPLVEEAEDIKFLKDKSLSKTRANFEKALREKQPDERPRRMIDELQQDQQEVFQTDTSSRRRKTRSSLSSGPFEVPDPSLSIPAESFYGKDNGSQLEVQPEKRSSARTAARRQSPEEETAPGWTVLNEDWKSKWKGSITYPPTGKNRAQVEMHDIERLDEGEFLNDSLINFYMRWLEQHLDPQIAKRIYFQNTFFYKALTTGKPGGEKGINYRNVERWTAKVDLLSYDYIVVPVNEHAHWYVAIICNAPELLSTDPNKSESLRTGEQSSSPAKGVLVPATEASRPGSPSTKEQQGSVSDLGDELGKSLTIISPDNAAIGSSIPGSTSPIHKTRSTPSKERPAPSMVDEKPETGSNRQTPIPIFDSLEQEVVEPAETAPETIDIDAAQAPAKKSIQPKKGKRKSAVRKHDPRDTRIITLDSLGLPHSPTCVNLRDYIVKEIQSKKNIDIPQPGPLGMTATNIPKQLNYCDCGLFLLSYVEKFIEDPDKFIENVCLGEKMEFQKAPELRGRIRDILFDLSQEQKPEAKPASRPKKGTSKKVVAEVKKTNPLADLEVTTASASAPVIAAKPEPKKVSPERQVPAAESENREQKLSHSRKRSASSDISSTESSKRLRKQADSPKTVQERNYIPKPTQTVVHDLDDDGVEASAPSITNRPIQISLNNTFARAIDSGDDSDGVDRFVYARRIPLTSRISKKRPLEIEETPEPETAITTNPSDQSNGHSLRSHEPRAKHQEYGSRSEQHSATSGSNHGFPRCVSRPSSSSSRSTLENEKADDVEMLLPNPPFGAQNSKSSGEPHIASHSAPINHAHPPLQINRTSPRARLLGQRRNIRQQPLGQFTSDRNRPVVIED